MTYDARGNVVTAAYANGMTTINTFDAARGWLTGLVTARSAASLQALSYARDAAGPPDGSPRAARPMPRIFDRPGTQARPVRAGPIKRWRKGWDSNPRWACTHAGFQDRCLKPLGHPSSVCGAACAPGLGAVHSLKARAGSSAALPAAQPGA
jgi:hypothetical protein